MQSTVPRKAISGKKKVALTRKKLENNKALQEIMKMLDVADVETIKSEY